MVLAAARRGPKGTPGSCAVCGRSPLAPSHSGRIASQNEFHRCAKRQAGAAGGAARRILACSAARMPWRLRASPEWRGRFFEGGRGHLPFLTARDNQDHQLLEGFAAPSVLCTGLAFGGRRASRVNSVSLWVEGKLGSFRWRQNIHALGQVEPRIRFWARPQWLKVFQAFLLLRASAQVFLSLVSD